MESNVDETFCGQSYETIILCIRFGDRLFFYNLVTSST
jgi:hypothetical protein